MNMYDVLFAQTINDALDEIDSSVEHVDLTFMRTDGKYRIYVNAISPKQNIYRVFASDFCDNMYDAIMNLSEKIK